MAAAHDGLPQSEARVVSAAAAQRCSDGDDVGADQTAETWPDAASNDHGGSRREDLAT